MLTGLLHAGPAAQQQRGVKALEQLAAEFDERVAVQQLKLMILRHSSITLAGQLVIMQSPSPSKDICFSLMFHDARLHSSRFCICFTKNIDKIFTSCT